MNNKNTDEGGPPPPRRRAVKLESARDCRRLLAKIVNGTYRDEVTPTKAGKIGFLLSILIRSFEEAEQRWASSGAQPGPAETAAEIRRLMRAADGTIPPPPKEG